MTRLAIVPPDDDPTPRPAAAPEGRNAWGVAEARRFIARLRDATDTPRWPWRALDAHIGPMLPGWLVLVGGRPKSGKTTLLLNTGLWWLEGGIKWVYVGTETESLALRIQMAAIEARVNVTDALKGALVGPADDRFNASLDKYGSGTYKGQYVLTGLGGATWGDDTPMSDLHELEQHCGYAQQMGARVLIFDYLQRLSTDPANPWSSLAAAVRGVKNLAKRYGLTIVAGAQLKQGEGLLGAHEVPGDNAWYGGAVMQQEADVAIQLWRPFRRGVTEDDRKAARAGDIAALTLAAPETMGVRIAAHRWNGTANGEVTRLRITDDWVSEWTL